VNREDTEYRKDIIRMAREAGFRVNTTESLLEELERFAALIASAEREACAKVCEEMRTYVGRNNAVTQSSAQDCATSIRARGEASIRGQA
jgi:hypothetical protein